MYSMQPEYRMKSRVEVFSQLLYAMLVSSIIVIYLG